MLPVLLETPRGEEGWNRFTFHNRESHQEIRQAIQAQLGVILPEYQLDPMSGGDTAGWLQRHSQTHGDMNSALKLQSVDLLDVNLNDPRKLEAWQWLHYLEHLNATLVLKI